LLSGLEQPPASTIKSVAADHRHDLERYVPLADGIERFWLDPLHQDSGSWKSHQDINSVMLVTSLLSSPIVDY